MWNIWWVFKERHHVSQGSTVAPPPSGAHCSCHQLPRPDLGGETLTYPQIWEWGEKGVGSALRLSETTQRARLLMIASHPSEHVISFIPWSAVSSHHHTNTPNVSPLWTIPLIYSIPVQIHLKPNIISLRSLPLNACTWAEPEGNQAEATFPHQWSRTQNVTLDFPTVRVGHIYAPCLVSVCYQLRCRRAVNTGTPLYTHWTGTLMLQACWHFQCVHIPQRDLLEGSRKDTFWSCVTHKTLFKEAGRQTRCFYSRWCTALLLFAKTFPGKTETLSTSFAEENQTLTQAGEEGANSQVWKRTTRWQSWLLPPKNDK